MKKSAIVLSLMLILISLMIFSGQSCSRMSDEQIISDPENALQICSGLSGMEQEDCYFHVSSILASSNISMASQACLGIKDEGPRSGCFNDLLNITEDADEMFEICKITNVPDFKKWCLETTAQKEKNATKAMMMCNEITNDNNFKEHCINLVVGEGNVDVDAKLTACSMREGQNKDYCYQEIGTNLFLTNATKGIEVCNKISDTNIKNNCLNYFTSSPELIKSNPDIAISICDSMTLKDNCYLNAANALTISNPQKATDICKRMSDEIQVANCFGMVWFNFDSRVSGNFDFSMGLCASLNLKKDDCYRRIAGIMQNIDKNKAIQACNMISSTNSPGCLQQVS